jgi:hypothetical protein
VLAAVLAGIVVVIIFSSGGGPATKHASANTTTVTDLRPSHHSHKGSSSGPSAAARAAMTVTVLNGTETEGLAHRTAAELQGKGYSQATALGGRPTGAPPATVVEYAPGQRRDAEDVARALTVSTVQPARRIRVCARRLGAGGGDRWRQRRPPAGQ